MEITALKIGLGIMVVSLIIYDGIGIWFLWKDFSTVQDCHASNKDAHAIWPTNLWTYVLSSVIAVTFASLMILAAPLGQSVEVGRKTVKRNASPRSGGELALLSEKRTKFGLVPGRPDWLFLWIGSIVIFIALMFVLMVFWGYWELFLARPWCTNTKAAFEELDLWHFGRVSFILQVVASILLFIWGLAYWSAPCLFELRDVFSAEDAP